MTFNGPNEPLTRLLFSARVVLPPAWRTSRVAFRLSVSHGILLSVLRRCHLEHPVSYLQESFPWRWLSWYWSEAPYMSVVLFGGLTLSIEVLPSCLGLLGSRVRVSSCLGMPAFPGSCLACLAFLSFRLEHPDSFVFAAWSLLLLRLDVSHRLLWKCWNY
jgi:hypothetical protein